MQLNDYLALFPGSTREKPRFMALAAAVLQQAADLQAVVSQINEAFAPQTANGAQLDALGASLGLSRADTSAGIAASDETFRDYILKKLILWGWDGTNRTVPAITERLQPGSSELDNQDGSVTITGAGAQPAEPNRLYPVPAGVGTHS